MKEPSESKTHQTDQRLDSWKEIATYLDRDVRTVQRWEKEEDLPIRRHAHHTKGSIYAYRSEIYTWLENRSTTSGWFRFFSENKKTVAVIAGGVTLLLLVGVVTWIGSSSNPEGLRPESFEKNVWAATEFIHVDNNLPQARKYLDSARNLITDAIIREVGSSVVKIMLFPAQEAWLRGDPETALAEIGKVWQKLESLGISGNSMLPVATLYYSLGKDQLADRLFTDNLDKKSLIRGLHQLAVYYEATKPHLKQYLGISEGSILDLPPEVHQRSNTAAIVLARAGFTGEAEVLITKFERDPIKRPQYPMENSFQMARGVLTLSKGNTTEGMRLIEEMLGQARGLNFLGSLILAEAWREQDQLESAMRVLEQASSKKVLLFAPVGGENSARWLRIRLMLAEIYREMGRDEDARKVEAELRTLLAYADADHPILRQLGHTEDVALLQPQKLLRTTSR